MPSRDSTALAAALGSVVASLGADLESVEVRPAGRRRVVRVVVDRDGGVDLDAVAEISTAVSAALDEDPVAQRILGDVAYVLEVTSPGVDRPLTEARHWRRSAGRLVAASLADGTEVTGRIDSATADEVVIDGRSLAYADIVRGLVQVEFAAPATAPATAED